ncbi:hypothetical protein NPIL_676871 [Nephila pilipes]|uniref:Uncharacterized protein n=1 Tax=Nephila pilipes TaxID=299642 RepID=A0A8X6UWG5_NEPPI|nr:hypothetical protein NPIL_497531 [Nephila pilipes]GFU53461.1 hypothetical protein NPIL_676871 [Nephila pilipes]
MRDTDKKSHHSVLVQSSQMTQDSDSSGLSRILSVEKKRVDSPRGTTVAHLEVVFYGQCHPFPKVTAAKGLHFEEPSDPTALTLLMILLDVHDTGVPGINHLDRVNLNDYIDFFRF